MTEAQLPQSPRSETRKSESEVIQSCPTLWDPVHCSLSGSSVHGIFQARMLDWFAISFSRGSSQPTTMRSPYTTTREQFPLVTTRKKAHTTIKIQQSKNKYIKLFFNRSSSEENQFNTKKQQILNAIIPEKILK